MVDIAVAVRLGAPEETDDARTDSIIARELATKILETIPQLYMQSYILFVTGTHGDPIKVTSIAISVLALSHGMLKAVGMDPDQKALKKLPFRFVSFLFLASDQAMRSAAFSLVLSQEVRPFGVTLMAVAAVATCGTYVWTAKAGDDLGEKVVFAFVFFFTIYLIPVWMWGDNDDELLGTVRGVRIRWLEMLLCAVLAYLVAKTNCGHAPSHEVAGLVGLLAFNLATYALMRSCFNWRTGDFRFQSTLEDWYRCITGCWTKGKAEDDEANALTAEDSDGNDEVSKVEPEAEPHEAEPNEKPEMVTTNESDDGAKTKPKRRVWKNLKRKPKSVANQKEGEEVVQRTLASLDAEEEDPTSGGDLQIDVEDQADLPQLPKEEKKKIKKGKKGKARGTKARSSTSPEAYMVGRDYPRAPMTTDRWMPHEASSPACSATRLRIHGEQANASAVEDVIWMVYKVAQRSDTAKAWILHAGGVAALRVWVAQKCHGYALDGLRSLAELLEGCRGSSLSEGALRGAIVGALYQLVSPRRSSKSAFATLEVVQPESVVVLITEALRIGGAINEDALWSSCTVLENLIEKDPRMAQVFLARGGTLLGHRLGLGVPTLHVGGRHPMDQLIRDICLTPARAAGDLISKSWYSFNFRAIRELVQDPSYRPEDPEPDEPVLEVVIGDAEIQEIETSNFESSVENERFLLLPRGSFSMRFQVIDHRERLKGECLLGTQSLWSAAGRAGSVSLRCPLALKQGHGQGHLMVHCRPWDGLPPERPWWIDEAYGYGTVGAPQRVTGTDTLGPAAQPDLFDMLDKDGDGVLSKEELHAAIQKSKAMEMSPSSMSMSPMAARQATHVVPMAPMQPLLLPISSRSSLMLQGNEGSMGASLGHVGHGGPMLGSLHPQAPLGSVRSQKTTSPPPALNPSPPAPAAGSPLYSPVQRPAAVSLPPQAIPTRTSYANQPFLSLPAQKTPDSPKMQQVLTQGSAREGREAMGPAVSPSRRGMWRSGHLNARAVTQDRGTARARRALLAERITHRGPTRLSLAAHAIGPPGCTFNDAGATGLLVQWSSELLQEEKPSSVSARLKAAGFVI
eukprot:g28591.t1